MSNPYIANERDLSFCSMCAFTLSGPQLAKCRNGKGRQPFGFRPQRGLSELRKLVVDPARVSRVALGNKTSCDHAVERAVQRSRTHFHGILRIRFDLLHDVVPMTLLAEEG